VSTSMNTTDHKEIRRWAEARGAVPSEVASTHKKNEPGILRFQFPGAPGERDDNLREISWDAFFERFDENNLELVYQEKTADGEKSNFNKLVHAEKSSSSGKSASKSKSSSSGGSGKSGGSGGAKSQASGKNSVAEVREPSDDEDVDDEDDDLDDDLDDEEE
jgi:hypothetical protein